MISRKIVITDFHEKLRKFSFMLFMKIKMMKDAFKKPKN